MYLTLEGEFRIIVHMLMHAHACGLATPECNGVLSQGQLLRWTLLHRLVCQHNYVQSQQMKACPGNTTLE